MLCMSVQRLLILMIFKWHLKFNGKCQKFSDMKLHEILYNAKYLLRYGICLLFPTPQIEFKWCEQAGVFAFISKDNKNSYFPHTNMIMRFSTSEKLAEMNYLFMNSSLTFNIFRHHRVCKIFSHHPACLMFHHQE